MLTAAAILIFYTTAEVSIGNSLKCDYFDASGWHKNHDNCHFSGGKNVQNSMHERIAI